MSDAIVPVILSGGAGTRLWPASRKHRPKQLLRLNDDRSLFLATVERAARLPGAAPPVVVSNQQQRTPIARELAGQKGARLILEPVGRNTAPALATAALLLTAEGSDPRMLVMPADHVITDEAALGEAVSVAARLADEGYLVTFGIAPSSPETGYGYIEPGADLPAGGMTVAAFTEKPDLPTAERYLSEGRHLWNSGMFLFRAWRYLEELDIHQPDVLAAADRALGAAKEEDGVITLDGEALAASPSISIDYAVMEPTELAAVVPLDAGWSDVGSWDAMWELGDADEDGNVLSGDVEVLDVTNSYVRGSNRLVAAVGLDNIAIVDTPDATLIAARDRVQDVKRIVDRLGDQDRREVETDGSGARSWGHFVTLYAGSALRLMRMQIEPGAKTPLQTHPDRSEYWIVVDGVALVTIGNTTRLVPQEDVVFVPAGEPHGLENPSEDAILEVVRLDVTAEE